MQAWIRWVLVALVALTTGCIKRPEPRKAAEPTPLAAVFLIDQESETEVLPGPPALIDGATTSLAERNLVVRALEPSEWTERFASQRSTRQRMLTLLDAVDEDVILLVETRARLASLMEGRYTWTVPVQITMVRRGRSDFPNQATLEVPVFMRFAHQDADDAVAAAAPVITRRLARMVEELLSEEDALGAVDPSAPADRPTGRESGASQTRELLGQRDAIYFAMVDRHRNGDPSNDRGADPRDPQGFHGGDLRGLIQDVDRLAGLGFKSLWVTPVWDTRDERIGEWGAFHGYWVEDPGAVEPRFGTEAELIELRDALADRGMGLIVDFVANHVAPGSPLLDAHPDWFHDHGDIEDWSNAEEAVTHDVHGLPDLAQENPEVAEWLLGHARGWQERLRPEGFRLDAVRHVAPAFWSELNGALRAEDDDVALVGELFDGDPRAVAQSWRDGAFGGMFDFPLHYALTDVFCAGAAPGRLAAMLEQDALYPDPSALVTFLDNHDLPRLASRCEAGDAVAALSVLLALRGRPSISWGTELPLDGAEEPANRADFDWDAERRWEKHIALGLRMRAAWSGLRATEREMLALDDGLVAWVQADEDSAAVVAVNRGDQARTVALPDLGSWQDPARRSGVEELNVAPGGVALAVTEGEGSALADWLARETGDVEVTVRLEGASIVKGDTSLLIGASEALGGWNPQEAVPTRMADGAFVATVEVPRGHVLEFKFVTRQDSGHLVWEERPNRYRLVQDAGEIVARWEA